MQKAPDKNCKLCPRLYQFREKNSIKFPDKFNAPVPSFGPPDSVLLVVGLAPGLKGANFTGRPFTGDYAGDLLYKALEKYGFSQGTYKGHINDGLTLSNCRITNAVRCVPPENKPTGEEIKNCQPFLHEEILNPEKLRVILALGKIAHDAVLRTLGHKLSDYRFAHNVQHNINDNLTLVDSYHCSRYNTQTGRLTEKMFFEVFNNIKELTNKN
jgi:uracil-DNA glycosylase family 4